LIKNSEPFGEKCQKTAGGIFDSYCTMTLLYSCQILGGSAKNRRRSTR